MTHAFSLAGVPAPNQCFFLLQYLYFATAQPTCLQPLSYPLHPLYHPQDMQCNSRPIAYPHHAYYPPSQWCPTISGENVVLRPSQFRPALSNRAISAPAPAPLPAPSHPFTASQRRMLPRRTVDRHWVSFRSPVSTHR